MNRTENSPPPTVATPALLSPRVKVWVEAEGGYSFGSGLVEMLEAVGRASSIKKAAADLGRSYRHVWDRIKDAERGLRLALVTTQVGGQGAQRSELTDDARRLISDFRGLRDRMIDAMELESKRRFQESP
jgi:molybdate transport repressor ModE-like protein